MVPRKKIGSCASVIFRSVFVQQHIGCPEKENTKKRPWFLSPTCGDTFPTSPVGWSFPRFKYLGKIMSLAPEQKDADGIPKAFPVGWWGGWFKGMVPISLGNYSGKWFLDTLLIGAPWKKPKNWSSGKSLLKVFRKLRGSFSFGRCNLLGRITWGHQSQLAFWRIVYFIVCVRWERSNK